MVYDDRLHAATLALKGARSTYVARHAENIARAALNAASEAEAVAAVQALIGHTAVGERRSSELARLARAAARGEVGFKNQPDTRPARCGFCGAVVSGDTTATALPSEAYAAHADALVKPREYVGDHCDYEVFACDQGTGCAK